MPFLSWHEYRERLKKYFWFSKREWYDLAFLVFFFALIFSFNKWGLVTFDFFTGFKNLILAIFIVGISVFIHHAVQRLFALYFGYKPEQRIWWIGILFGLIFLTHPALTASPIAYQFVDAAEQAVVKLR